MFRTLSLCACCRHSPGAATRRIASLTSPSRVSLPPIWQSGRPAHCPFRGLLGVHSRYGLHTRAVTVFRDTLSEGFSHFGTSIAAPVASSWSGCRVGLTPTGKRRLFTAHARTGLSALPVLPLFTPQFPYKLSRPLGPSTRPPALHSQWCGRSRARGCGRRDRRPSACHARSRKVPRYLVEARLLCLSMSPLGWAKRKTQPRQRHTVGNLYDRTR